MSWFKTIHSAKVTTPKIKTPKIKTDVTPADGPFKASAEVQSALGFSAQKPDNWQQIAIDKVGEIASSNRSVKLFLDICVKCGACSDKCHYYLGGGDAKNMPVARQDLLRSVYRRYYTLSGKYLPKLVGAKDLTQSVLDDWYNYFHQCSQCRRCAVFCPYGIDTAEISMAAREVLNAVGMGQKYTNQVLGKALRIGNNLGLIEAALTDIVEDLSEEIEQACGVRVEFPLDKKDATVLLVTPSADFFAEPHVDGLIGYAKVFHQSRTSWTLSTQASEAANFGVFIGNYEVMKAGVLRIRQAVLDLRVKRVVVGECGHAWRVAYSFWNTLGGIGQGAGEQDVYAQALQRQLDKRYPAPQHIIEFTYALIQAGKLTIDKSKNNHRVVTFHDSCNVARGSTMGGINNGQFILPRAVIKAVCEHYVDMAADTIGARTFCCGGGGGLLTDELMEIRITGAKPRMHALTAVTEQQAVNTLAAICAICKSQFSAVLPHYQFDPEMVVSVHQLVSDAIVLKE